VRREKSRRRRRPAKSLPAEEEREEEEEEEHEREEREREDEMLLLFSTAKERAVVVVVVVEMRLASVILFSSCEEHERKKKISTFSTKKRERESSTMKKKKKDDDLSRFNSSSSSSEEEEEEEEDKRIVEDGGKKWFADAAKSQPTTQPPTSNPISSTGEVAQQQPETKKRMNAAERKRLKKRDSQSARVERRKRERERMERDKREGEEESRAEKKKKKRKKKKKATAEEESDGGDDENDVTETDEEEEEEERKIGQTKKNHRTTFEVEGVALADGTLVLVDKRSSVVYSSEERDDNGEHKRIGTWNAATKTVVKRDDEGEDGNANRNGRSNSSSSEQSDNNASSSSSSSLSSQGEEEEEEKQREPTELVKLDVNHTFECNPDDHCETSLEAHKDIVNFLNIVASQKNKKPSELVIYDPYYCAGATKTNFTELGFPNVINENKDFYEVVAKNEVPEHDVFVTNPPYSEEHVEKCVAFAAKNMTQFSRPYFMLVPSYVVCKPYFVPALLSGGAQGAEERDNALKDKDENEEMNMHKKRGQVLPFYIAPTKRYYYFTPKPLAKLRNKNIAENGMEKKRRGHVGRRGERTSPFLSLWICGFGDDQMEALRLHKKLRKEQVKHYVVARNPKEIPLNVLDEWDPRRRGEPGAQDSSKKANVQKNKKKYF